MASAGFESFFISIVSISSRDLFAFLTKDCLESFYRATLFWIWHTTDMQKQRLTSKNSKAAGLMALYLLLVLFSVWIGFQIDRVQENLTGLGWKNGHLLLMGIYCLFACGYDGWLSWRVLMQAGYYVQGRLSALMWAFMALGALIPWKDPGLGATLDLHSLVCTTAIIANGLIWLWVSVYGLTSPFFRQVCQLVLGCLILSVAVFASSGCISYLCEAAYVLSNGLVLLLAANRVGSI